MALAAAAVAVEEEEEEEEEEEKEEVVEEEEGYNTSVAEPDLAQEAEALVEEEQQILEGGVCRSSTKGILTDKYVTHVGRMDEFRGNVAQSQDFKSSIFFPTCQVLLPTYVQSSTVWFPCSEFVFLYVLLQVVELFYVRNFLLFFFRMM